MAFVPTDKDLSQYGSKPWGMRDLPAAYVDYLKGAGLGMLQSGAEGGRNLAMLPSKAYEMITDEPLYDLPKPDVLGLAPESTGGKIGTQVGHFQGEAFKNALESLYGGQVLRAINRFHPLSKRLMGRQIQRPLDVAENQGVRFNLHPREIHNVNELLSHPALSAEGQTSKALTPMGREALIRSLQRGGPHAGHSTQSLLGELERTVSKLGENELVNTRIRPAKDLILRHMTESMEDAGLPEEAQNYQAGREGARRYYQTRAATKKAAKVISPMTYLKMALSALKASP